MRVYVDMDDVLCDRLILCPDKSLLKGDVLIDDTPWPGFEGQQLLFSRQNPVEEPEVRIDWLWILTECELLK